MVAGDLCVDSAYMNDRGPPAAGIDRAQVAEKLVETYLQQIFDDGVFHADPHPGNLFVAPVEGRPGDFRLTFVDFGMVVSTPSSWTWPWPRCSTGSAAWR